MFQVTPILALAPPLAVWLGFGPQPKIVMAALVTFVPFFTNATVGFRPSTPPPTRSCVRSTPASWRSFPGYGCRTACRTCSPRRGSARLALIGAVVAEFFNSSAGLGNIIAAARRTTRQQWSGRDLHSRFPRRRPRRPGHRCAAPTPALVGGRPGPGLAGLCTTSGRGSWMEPSKGQLRVQVQPSPAARVSRSAGARLGHGDRAPARRGGEQAGDTRRRRRRRPASPPGNLHGRVPRRTAGPG